MLSPPRRCRARCCRPGHPARAAQLRRNSQDADAYYRLGDAYIQKARETGDLSYFSLAEQCSPQSHGDRSDARRRRPAPRVRLLGPPRLPGGGGPGIESDRAQSRRRGCLWRARRRLSRARHVRPRGRGIRRDDAPEGRPCLPWPAVRDQERARRPRGGHRGAAAAPSRPVSRRPQPRESIAWAQWQLGAEHFATRRDRGRRGPARRALCARIPATTARWPVWPRCAPPRAGTARRPNCTARRSPPSRARICRRPRGPLHEDWAGRRRQEAVRPRRVHRPAERPQQGALQPRAGLLLRRPRREARRGSRARPQASSRRGAISTPTICSRGRSTRRATARSPRRRWTRRCSSARGTPSSSSTRG